MKHSCVLELAESDPLVYGMVNILDWVKKWVNS